MAYRKYDTCFFERYAALTLQNMLGHKFDDLVNEDRPDLQSSDGKTLGIEVTRAMEGGKEAAQTILKEMAGVHPVKEPQYRVYWQLARPLREIIANKVGKVGSGFYGSFEEFGLFVYSQESLSIVDARKAMTYIMELQKFNETGYARLFLSDLSTLFVCNLEDDISYEFRISEYPIDPELRKEMYLKALFG